MNKKWWNYFNYKNKYIIYSALAIAVIGFAFMFIPLVIENFPFKSKKIAKLLSALMIIMTGVMLTYPTFKYLLRFLNKTNKEFKYKDETIKLVVIIKTLFTYLHLFIAPIVLMFSGWHMILAFQEMHEWTFQIISGLLLFISFLLLYFSGLFMMLFFMRARKYKIHYLHMLGTLFLIIGIVIHMWILG